MENQGNAALAAVARALENNNRVMERILTHFQKEASPWVDPDEAARLLGIRLSKSGNHRRKVAYLAKNGFIDRYKEGRPFQYWRDDVLALQPKIANGSVQVPSRV